MCFSTFPHRRNGHSIAERRGSCPRWRIAVGQRTKPLLRQRSVVARSSAPEGACAASRGLRPSDVTTLGTTRASRRADHAVRPRAVACSELHRPHRSQHRAELPRFIKDEFDADLECGILAHGSQRLRQVRPRQAAGLRLQTSGGSARHAAPVGCRIPRALPGRPGQPVRASAPRGLVAAERAATAGGRCASDLRRRIRREPGRPPARDGNLHRFELGRVQGAEPLQCRLTLLSVSMANRIHRARHVPLPR